jgi:hypothetical protein
MGKWIFLDDERQTKVGFDIRTYTAEETIELIKKDSDIEFVSLDNDLGLGRMEGYKVADYLEELYFTTGRFIGFHPHTNNPSAFDRIMQTKRKVYKDFESKGGKRNCP